MSRKLLGIGASSKKCTGGQDKELYGTGTLRVGQVHIVHCHVAPTGTQMELLIPTTVINSLPGEGQGHTKPRREQYPFV